MFNSPWLSGVSICCSALLVMVLGTPPLVACPGEWDSIASHAQQSEQVPSEQVVVSGILQLRDGKPWAGANVRFVSNLAGWLPELGRRHLVEVTTNGKGAFRAMLLRGRHYSVGASQLQEDGAYPISKPQRFTPVGFHRLQLVESAHARHQITTEIPVQGLELWKGPKLKYLVGDKEVAGPDDENRLAIPLTASWLARVRAIDESGRVVGRTLVYLRKDNPKGRGVLKLRAVHPILIRVVGAAGPIRGAEVSGIGQDDGFHGWTDKNGLVVYRHVDSFVDNRPKRFGPPAVHLHVRAKGYTDLLHDLEVTVADVKQASGRAQRYVIPANRDVVELRGAGKEDLEIRMQPGASIRGTVHWNVQTPAARLRLLVASPLDRQGHSMRRPGPVPPHLVVATDETGAFQVDGLRPGSSYIVWADLETTAGVIRDSTVTSPLGVLAVGEAKVGSVDLGRINLEDERVTVTLRLPRGARADHARLWIDVQPWTAIADMRHMPVLVDRRGTTTMILSKEARVRLAAVHPQAFGFLETNASRMMTLTLDEAVPLSGQVLDKAGAPLAGVWVTAVLLGSQPPAGAPLGPRLRMIYDVSGPYQAETNGSGEFRIMVPMDSWVALSATKSGGFMGPSMKGPRSIVVQTKPITGLVIRE